MVVINIPGICSPIITTDNEHATLVVSGGRKAKARREMSFRQYFTFFVTRDSVLHSILLLKNLLVKQQT